jgi:hypothetical protein
MVGIVNPGGSTLLAVFRTKDAVLRGIYPLKINSVTLCDDCAGGVAGGACTRPRGRARRSDERERSHDADAFLSASRDETVRIEQELPERNESDMYGKRGRSRELAGEWWRNPRLAEMQGVLRAAPSALPNTRGRGCGTPCARSAFASALTCAMVTTAHGGIGPQV